MENVVTIAFLASICFALYRFVEIKYLEEEETKPLKFFVRDVVMVFLCTAVSAFVYFYMSGSIHDFMDVITETKSINPATTQIFTDTPGF